MMVQPKTPAYVILTWLNAKQGIIKYGEKGYIERLKEL